MNETIEEILEGMTLEDLTTGYEMAVKAQDLAYAAYLKCVDNTAKVYAAILKAEGLGS